MSGTGLSAWRSVRGSRRRRSNILVVVLDGEGWVGVIDAGVSDRVETSSCLGRIESEDHD